MRMRGCVPVLLIAAIGMESAAARGGWISSDDYASLNAVVADSASDSEKLAAREFADLWKQATGKGVYVSNVPYLKRGIIVWIGQDGVPDELLGYVKPGELGTDGYCIRTLYLKKSKQGHLAIFGGKERGTMYGVYAFFEDYFGIRFLTPDYTYIPKKPPASLPNIDVRYVPPILHRQTTYGLQGMQTYSEDQRAAFQRHMRWSFPPESGLPAHSVFTILPPGKYFAEHPDYYSEIHGKRTAPTGFDPRNPVITAPPLESQSQLCFSNPKVAEAIAAELRPLMQASPEKIIWNVSRMDWDGRCECPDCKAIDEAEDSPMGSVLTCVNRVADAIRSDFPNQLIETLAYQWTLKPPRNLRPRDNVIIGVCAIDADYSRPISDKKEHGPQPFAGALTEWSKIAKNIHVWDYPANIHYSQTPFPSFNVIGPNMAFFAQQNVKGILSCGGGMLSDDLGALRCYLVSRLMWQPNADAQAIMDEFIQLYYEDAAPFIREYIALASTAVRDKGAFLHCLGKSDWMDADIVVRADDIFRRALASSVPDIVKQRIEDAYCSIRYAAIVCPPRVTITGDRISIDRPPCMSVEEYIAHVGERGARSFEANVSLPDYIMARTGKSAPPRHEESPIITLENEKHRIWVAPALKGSVVRWNAKEQAVELLRGYMAYGSAPGTLQEWTCAPPLPEGPAADTYEVVEGSQTRLVLRAARPDGLQIERTMELKPGSDSLCLTLVITNTSNKPLSANIKIHPEFHVEDPPEIWAPIRGTWQRQNAQDAAAPYIASRFISAEEATRIVCWMPGKKLAVECGAEAQDLGGLIWHINTAPDARQCNLEVLPKNEPIEPGAQRTLLVRYSVSSQHSSPK